MKYVFHCPFCSCSGSVKRQTKWGWSNFAGLAICELVNQCKVTFFTGKNIAKVFLIISPTATFALSFGFVLEKDPQKLYFGLMYSIIQDKSGIFHYS